MLPQPSQDGISSPHRDELVMRVLVDELRPRRRVADVPLLVERVSLETCLLLVAVYAIERAAGTELVLNVTDVGGNRGKVHLHHGASIDDESEGASGDPLDELSREHEEIGSESSGVDVLPLVDIP